MVIIIVYSKIATITSNVNVVAYTKKKTFAQQSDRLNKITTFDKRTIKVEQPYYCYKCNHIGIAIRLAQFNLTNAKILYYQNIVYNARKTSQRFTAMARRKAITNLQASIMATTSK